LKYKNQHLIHIFFYEPRVRMTLERRINISIRSTLKKAQNTQILLKKDNWVIIL